MAGSGTSVLGPLRGKADANLARCSAVSGPKRKYTGLEHRPRIAAEERMIYCIGMWRLGIRPRRREIAAKSGRPGFPK